MGLVKRVRHFALPLGFLERTHAFRRGSRWINCVLLSRHSPSIRMLVLCGAVLIGAIVGIRIVAAYHFRNVALNHAGEELTKTAALLARYLDQQMEEIAVVQHHVIDGYLGLPQASMPVDAIKRRMSGEELHRILEQSVAISKSVDRLSIVDADGNMVNSTYAWPLRDINVADRDYFKSLKSSDTLSTALSEPLRSRLSGTSTLIIARKLSGPARQFLGLMQAEIELSRFERFFESLKIEEGASIAILNRDGTMLARYPGNPDYIGRNFVASPLFQELILKRDRGLMTLERTMTDGETRLVAAENIGNAPLAIAVSKTTGSALALWHEQAIVLAFIAVFSGVIVVFGTSLIIRQLAKEHATSELRLLQEKERLDTAVDSMVQGVLLFDATRRIVIINRRYIELYGLAPNAVKPGCTLRELIEHRKQTGSFSGDVNEHHDAIVSSVERGETRYMTTTTPDGRTIKIMARAAARGGWVSTHEDITEQLRLQTDKEAAEASSSANQTFLAVMSHEIRTPLNGVLGALELMRHDALPDRSARNLQIATECGETLLDLIDDILLFSRLDQSELQLSAHPFSPATLFRSIATSMQPLVAKGGNTLHVDFQSELKADLNGDATRLRQVLVNLISNAAKFTQDGHIYLRAKGQSYEERVTLDLTVTDTGIGIPKDKQQRIFERFRTLDASYTRRNDGTGLGLAICDKLVKAMGGKLAVTSEVGHGSTFYFSISLPLAVQPDRPNQAGVSTSDGERSLSILLAEDNPTNAYIVTEYLEDAGHSVLQARTGREASQLAFAMPFDVILMDVSMPEMDGIEATARIRSGGTNCRTPIIALTAHANPGDREKFLACQMDGYLTKPIRRTEILKAVNDYTTRDRIRAAAAHPCAQRAVPA